MHPELGQFALSLALVLALLQSFLPIIGAARKDRMLMQSAAVTAFLIFLLMTIAFVTLAWGFVVSDFTIRNVVENSHTAKPLIFKLAATWGSHEGSLLLWILVLASFGAGVGVFGKNLPLELRARTASVQAWIIVGFLSFLLFTSNPFVRISPPPLNGQDLNPLLQDISLVLHPPMLYIGYVGFSIVFSFTIAALIEGRIDPLWARSVRPWALLAWGFLTGGIALGSWWAYYELGWGGWWFWDPVENVSFMPWLMGTALLHSLAITQKRNAQKTWTVLLAILTFSFALLGTFIVRSGLITSVHAFASDPTRGSYILVLLGLAIGGAFILYAWRADRLRDGATHALLSRETGLLVNSILLATATCVVLIGTLFPLGLEAVNGDKISVGPPYYNGLFVPLMAPLILFMGVGPFLQWRQMPWVKITRALRWGFLSICGFGLVFWYLVTKGPLLAVIFLTLALWVAGAVFWEWGQRVQLGRVRLNESLKRARRQTKASYGMMLGHLGIAVCIIGFVGSSAFKQEEIRFASIGEPFEFAGFRLIYEGVEQKRGPNYMADQGTIFVERLNGAEVVRLHPERRRYFVAKSETTEAAIYSRIIGDLYISLTRARNPEPGQEWVLRVIYEPFVGWIWLGAAMIVLAALLAYFDRGLRVSSSPRSGFASSQTGGRE